MNPMYLESRCDQLLLGPQPNMTNDSPKESAK